MDVYERRRNNLRGLIALVSQAELARKSGVHSTYISRSLLEPGASGYKNIGEITARKLEAGAKLLLGISKPDGWLDAGPPITGSMHATLPALQLHATGGPSVPSAAPEDRQIADALAQLQVTIDAIPPLLQDSARSALAKWASGQIPLANAVATIDALRAAGPAAPSAAPQSNRPTTADLAAQAMKHFPDADYGSNELTSRQIAKGSSKTPQQPKRKERGLPSRKR